MPFSPLRRLFFEPLDFHDIHAAVFIASASPRQTERRCCRCRDALRTMPRLIKSARPICRLFRCQLPPMPRAVMMPDAVAQRARCAISQMCFTLIIILR
jgi:hypothetical protein